MSIPGSVDQVPMRHRVHLANTQAFIVQNPLLVQLSRRARTATPSGGWKYSEPYVGHTAIMRLVAATGQDGGANQRFNESGAVVTVSYTLIGMPDEDVQVGDQFVNPDNESEILEVLTVTRNPPWRVHAEMWSHGR